MLKLGITLTITGFIFLLLYGILISPLTDITDLLVDEGDSVLTDADSQAKMNTLLEFIPTAFGVISVILFIGAAITFTANALNIEPREEKYR